MYSVMLIRLRQAQARFEKGLSEAHERAADAARGMEDEAERARRALEDELIQLRAQNASYAKNIEMLEQEMVNMRRRMMRRMINRRQHRRRQSR